LKQCTLFVFVVDRIYIATISRDGKNHKELTVKAGDIIEVFTWKIVLNLTLYWSPLRHCMGWITVWCY